MKKLLILLPVFLIALPGCLVIRDTRYVPTHSKGKSRDWERDRPDCHPSQYWDGHQCRHKGKGKGARKHDD
jgi:hypothetical protein